MYFFFHLPSLHIETYFEYIHQWVNLFTSGWNCFCIKGNTILYGPLICIHEYTWLILTRVLSCSQWWLNRFKRKAVFQIRKYVKHLFSFKDNFMYPKQWWVTHIHMGMGDQYSLISCEIYYISWTWTMESLEWLSFYTDIVFTLSICNNLKEANQEAHFNPRFSCKKVIQLWLMWSRCNPQDHWGHEPATIPTTANNWTC